MSVQQIATVLILQEVFVVLAILDILDLPLSQLELLAVHVCYMQCEREGNEDVKGYMK